MQQSSGSRDWASRSGLDRVSIVSMQTASYWRGNAL